MAKPAAQLKIGIHPLGELSELASYYHRVHYVYPSSYIDSIRVSPNFFRPYTSRKTGPNYIMYVYTHMYRQEYIGTTWNVVGKFDKKGKEKFGIFYQIYNLKQSNILCWLSIEALHLYCDDRHRVVIAECYWIVLRNWTETCSPTHTTDFNQHLTRLSGEVD